jgi:hypothetical protein
VAFSGIFLWHGDLAIMCGVLWRFAAFSSVLQHFAAFSGVFRRVGNKLPLQDQIFGGAQTPTPFSGWLKIIMPNGGALAPFPN